MRCRLTIASAISRTICAPPTAARWRGWVDVGHALGQSGVPTVPTAGFSGTEFAAMRCDYLLASQALAAHAKSCRVIRTPVTDMASDHYPVLATFELPR